MKNIDEMIKQLCPNGVEYKQLGDICNIKGRIGFRGYTRKDQVNEGEGALSLSPGNIMDGQMDYTKGTYITWAKYDESPEIMTYNGDIIFCKTASVGKVALVKNLPCKATINPQLVVLKEIKCNASFLAYILETDKVQNKVISMAGVGSVPNISQKALSEIEIPLPPLSIQEEIVRVLDKFSELIEKTDEEIALRQKQYEYYREKMLTFEDGEVEWKKIPDVAKYSTGLTYKPANVTDNGTLVLRSSNIKDGFLAFDDNVYVTMDIPERAKVKKGDLLICVRNGSKKLVGKCAMITEEADGMAFGAFMNILRAEKCDNKYLFYVWQKDSTVKQYKGDDAAPICQITNKDFSRITIPLPSLSRQQEIVATLDKFEALISKLKEERELRQKQYEYYREKLLTF